VRDLVRQRRCAESVIDVDDTDAWRAAGEHRVQRRHTAGRDAVATTLTRLRGLAGFRDAHLL